MLFSSITFIYYFLPITLILYFLVPVGRGENTLYGKNSLLLLASFLFYSMGEPIYLFLMIASVFVGYIGGKVIVKFPRKIVLACFIGMQLSLLGVFKYSDFIIETWNFITGFNVAFLYLGLPIGISFYSFQIISYLVDVYRHASENREVQCEDSLINFATYITMFPQLIAGPIVRYETLRSQMQKRTINLVNVSEGATRFLIGLGKKVLIADNLGELLSRIEKAPEKSVWTYWLVAVMYLLQVYHDFSGYSDMAIGLGKMLGFQFPENFRYPLISKSVTEFWRRWHISLGTFLKDYIYIPLKGSRCSKGRWIFNIAVVWFLSGLWHGASWNFILWGLYFGMFLVIEKLVAQVLENKKNIMLRKNENAARIETGEQIKCSGFGAVNILHGIQRCYLSIVIVISFVLFRFVDITQAVAFITEMFRLKNNSISFIEWYEYKNVAFLLIVGIIGATPLPAKVTKYLLQKIKNCKVTVGVEWTFQIIMLLVITAFLIQSSVHPFLYFRF